MPWLEITDETTGRPYYYNEETEETTWTMPQVQNSPTESDFGAPPPRIMHLLIKNLSKAATHRLSTSELEELREVRNGNR